MVTLVTNINFNEGKLTESVSIIIREWYSQSLLPYQPRKQHTPIKFIIIENG